VNHDGICKLDYVVTDSVTQNIVSIIWFPYSQATCKEFGVEHRYFDTFGECLASNHRYLDRLATGGQKDLAEVRLRLLWYSCILSGSKYLSKI
jgi:hypothetical protein